MLTGILEAIFSFRWGALILIFFLFYFFPKGSLRNLTKPLWLIFAHGGNIRGEIYLRNWLITCHFMLYFEPSN